MIPADVLNPLCTNHGYNPVINGTNHQADPEVCPCAFGNQGLQPLNTMTRNKAGHLLVAGIHQKETVILDPQTIVQSLSTDESPCGFEPHGGGISSRPTFGQTKYDGICLVFCTPQMWAKATFLRFFALARWWKGPFTTTPSQCKAHTPHTPSSCTGFGGTDRCEPQHGCESL